MGILGERIFKLFFGREKIMLDFFLVLYILQATEMETDKLVKSIAGITEKGGEIAMTTAEKLRQEGLQKGRQEGMAGRDFSRRRDSGNL